MSRASADRMSGLPAGLTGLRILIVEDVLLVADLIRDQLESFGCTVIGPTARVDSALRLLETTPLDGALLDVNLAGELSSNSRPGVECAHHSVNLQSRPPRPVDIAVGTRQQGCECRLRIVLANRLERGHRELLKNIAERRRAPCRQDLAQAGLSSARLDGNGTAG